MGITAHLPSARGASAAPLLAALVAFTASRLLAPAVGLADVTGAVAADARAAVAAPPPGGNGYRCGRSPAPPHCGCGVIGMEQSQGF